MSTKRVRLISIVGIILITLVIGAGLIINLLSNDTVEVPLPQTSASVSPTEATGGPTNSGLDHVTVSKDNVQAVIATLHRPVSYSRSIQIEKRYAGDSTSYAIVTAVDKGATALKITGPGMKENIIIAGGKLYIWYDSNKTLYERPVTTSEDEKKSSDAYQMILSYEDVLALDKNSITDAAYTEYTGGDYAGEGCIYVQYVTELLRYTAKCYISVNNGLLIYAEMYDGNTLIYKMSSSAPDPAEPDPSVFALPDGTNPVTGP